ncbi:MAG: hypothetical protein WC178_04030 [Candidatus Paceibacterota bacterium]
MKVIDKSKLVILTCGIIVVGCAVFLPVFASAQNLSVSEFEVSDVVNNSAIIKWRTPGAKTSGILYLGETENKFDRSFKFDNYSYDHQITVGSLQKNKIYFYKIIIADREGGRREFFIRSFSTSQMLDTRRPEILDLDVVSNSYGAIVLHWTTNEETNSKITYGTSADNLDKFASVGGMSTEQEIILSNLKSGNKYYIKVTVRDGDKNETSKTVTASTYGNKSDAVLKISDVSPVYFDASVLSARTATLTFKTNLPAKSLIRYGTSLKSMNSQVNVSKSRDLKHTVEIDGLEPLTTYFFSIEAYDSLYSLRTKTDVLSFETGDLSVRYPSGSFVRAEGNNKVYLIYENTKAWIESPAVFLGLGFKGEWVQNVPAYALQDYKEVKAINYSHTHPNGSLVKYDNSPTIYFIDGGRKRPIANPDAFVRNGFKWESVVTISAKKEFYSTGDYVN